MSRILKCGENQITQNYASHEAKVKSGKAWAKGVDVVKYKSQIDKVIAHSAGRVLRTVDYLSGTNGILDKAGMGYGNYIMILHENNYVTLYAHLESVYVREGQTVNQGDEIGIMGNTGNSFGAHLHFEVRRYGANPAGNLHDTSAFEWLDPTDYLDAALPGKTTTSVNTVGVPNTVKAGTQIKLNAVSVYGSENGNSIGTRSGIYFVWSDETKNGRVRMTNSAARVGINGQVSFWVDVKDITTEKFINKTETAATSASKPASEVAKTKIRSYTVRAGDSLWAIAANQLGNGRRYKEIMNLNGLKNNVIYTGQVLKLPV